MSISKIAEAIKQADMSIPNKAIQKEPCSITIRGTAVFWLLISLVLIVALINLKY